MRKEQIGIQLYTLRDLMKDDFEGTLKKVADMGYPGVEFAGFGDYTAEDVKGMLDRFGLKAFSAHIGEPMFADNIEGVISDLKTVGANWAIVPAMNFGELIEGEFDWGALGSLTPEEITAKYPLQEEPTKQFAQRLERYAGKIEDAGLKFGYHNHHFEFLFKTSEGTPMIDILLANTSSKVHFELDAFWAAVGGYDPADVIRQHADRVRLVHLKDAGEKLPGKDVPFGTGILEWDGILEEADKAGVEFYITEQDNPSPVDPAKDAETSLRNAEKACK